MQDGDEADRRVQLAAAKDACRASNRAAGRAADSTCPATPGGKRVRPRQGRGNPRGRGPGAALRWPPAKHFLAFSQRNGPDADRSDGAVCAVVRPEAWYGSSQGQAQRRPWLGGVRKCPRLKALHPDATTPKQARIPRTPGEACDPFDRLRRRAWSLRPSAPSAGPVGR